MGAVQPAMGLLALRVHAKANRTAALVAARIAAGLRQIGHGRISGSLPIRSELPPDRHWKEPLRSAAGAEEAEVVGRDQKPGLGAPISDTDTDTKPGSQRIGSRFPIREPAHAWAKAEEPRGNRDALRRLNGRGQD